MNDLVILVTPGPHIDLKNSMRNADIFLPMKGAKMTKANSRQSEYPIDPLFLERWSPRAFTGEAMPADDLLTILDAAHWAPSASNFQPWRFIYAHNGSE